MRFLRPLLAACCLFIAAQARAAGPALWVAHNGNATVYLFGTIHVLPPHLVWMDQAILAALSQSEELWTEADITDLGRAVKAINRYGLTDSEPAEALLPENYRARFHIEADESHVSPSLLAHARPWLAEILLNAGAMQQSGPLSMGAEAALLAYAHTHNIATPTFETLEGQFAMLADMPMAAQLTSLEQQIDEFDQAGPMFKQLLTAWSTGDDRTLDKLTNLNMRAENEEVWTELILRRNEHFAQRISERLQGKGTFFVAVGAAHLCGSDGVPALLKNYGITVTRVAK